MSELHHPMISPEMKPVGKLISTDIFEYMSGPRGVSRSPDPLSTRKLITAYLLSCCDSMMSYTTSLMNRRVPFGGVAVLLQRASGKLFSYIVFARYMSVFERRFLLQIVNAFNGAISILRLGNTFIMRQT